MVRPHRGQEVHHHARRQRALAAGAGEQALDVGAVAGEDVLGQLQAYLPGRAGPGDGGVGLVIDLALRVVPEPDLLAARIPLLVVGILVTGLGMGLYIGAGLGPGPRDGLMTGLAAKGFPLWAVRTVLELTALAAGWVLGGNVGIGTVAFAFSIGPLGQFFLAHLHLESVPADLGPGAVGE